MHAVKSSSKLKFRKDLPVNDAVHDLAESSAVTVLKSKSKPRF